MASSNVVKLGSKIKTVFIKDKEVVKETVISENVVLPDDSPARMKTLRAEGRKWYLTVVYHEVSKHPFALFCHTNHNEKSAQTSDAVERLLSLARTKGILEEFVSSVEDKVKNDSNPSKVTRSISLLLRHGVAIKNIVGELDKMQDVFVGSFLFQIKKFLSNYIHDGEEAEGGCSECGGVLIYSEGCMACKDCGSSKCG